MRALPEAFCPALTIRFPSRGDLEDRSKKHGKNKRPVKHDKNAETNKPGRHRDHAAVKVKTPMGTSKDVRRVFLYTAATHRPLQTSTTLHARAFGSALVPRRHNDADMIYHDGWIEQCVQALLARSCLVA